MTEPSPADQPKTTVHILREGRALCGRPGVPGTWNTAEKWVSFDSVDKFDGHETMLCTRCKHVHETGESPPKLGYALLVSDRTGQVLTVWCPTCGDAFTFHVPCSVSMFSAIGKQFGREHRRCK